MTYNVESGVVVTFYRPTSARMTVIPQGTPVSGTPGDDGTDGKTIVYGTVPPTGGVGNNGDTYIDTNANKIYYNKSAGVWPAGVSLIGPAGSSVAGGVHGFLTGGM